MTLKNHDLTAVYLHYDISLSRKAETMLTPSDILVIILIVGSIIFIFFARKSKSIHGTDKLETCELEKHNFTNHAGEHSETNECFDHITSKDTDSQCRCEQIK